MAEFNYWQELGLDPLWVQREPKKIALAAAVEAQPEVRVSSETRHVPIKAAIEVPLSASVPLSAQKNEEPVMETAADKKDAPIVSAPVLMSAPAAISAMPEKNRMAEPGENAIATMDWEPLESQIHGCKECQLHCTRTQAVPGVGPRHASWMVIGEAPGADEDKQGEPFVGQAGKLLDAMLASLGRSRKESVYIANVLKCRPPNNRKPEPHEVAACAPYLHRQLALVQPKVLLAVGATAAQALLNTDAPIGRLRGTVHEYQGKPLVVTYHPAYLLRSPLEKAKAWIDLCLLQKVAKNLSDSD